MSLESQNGRDGGEGRPFEPDKRKKRLPLILWALSALFFLSALVYAPNLSSFFFLLAAFLLLPIDKLKERLSRLIPKRAVQHILAAVLAFAAIATAPTDKTEMPEAVPSPSPSVQVTDNWDLPAAEKTAPPSPASTAAKTPDTPVSAFEVHFIDVGQADAALVLCDGKAMLIDGGNAADSSLIYAYLKKLNVTELDYIVATHPHEDHVGGLAGALNFAKAGTALCPVRSYDSEAFRNFVKYLNEQGKSITVPKAGDTFSLGSAQVQVLGPITLSENANNNSLVLRIVYGDTSFLFMGDAEREEENAILDAGYAVASTVLKVGHHGAADSTNYRFLREVMPQYAVISVGAGNKYGHPDEAALSRLRDAEVNVYRTDLHGTIVCTSDGKTVTFNPSKNAGADPFEGLGPNSAQSPQTPSPSPPPSPSPSPMPQTTTTPSSKPSPSQPAPAPEPKGATYILNKSSKIFHYPHCGSVTQMKESNKIVFSGTREEVIAQGYTPCKNCNP